MPNLFIDVEARIAQFQDSLNKVDKSVAGLGQRLQRSFSVAGSAVAGFAGVLSVGAMAAFTRAVVDSSAAVDDLAESSGGSVEGLSKLIDIAKIGGGNIDTVSTAITALNRALQSTDADENRGIGSALKAIGLDAQELLRLAPDKRIEEVAKAMSGFADGAGKGNVAFALFRKRAEEVVPFLNDVSENLDRSASLTADQARRAEELSKAWNALTLDAGNLARSGILKVVEAFQELQRFVGRSGGIANAIRDIFDPQSELSLGAEIAQMERRLALIQDDTEYQKLNAEVMEKRARLAELIRTRPPVPEGPKPQVDFTAPAETEKTKKTARAEDPLKAQRDAILAVGELAHNAAEADAEIERIRESFLRMTDPVRQAAQEFRQFETIAPALGLSADEIERIKDALREKIAVAEFGEPLKNIIDTVDETKDRFEELKDVINGWSRQASQAFADFAFGAKQSIGDMLQSIARQFVAMQAQKLIFDPLFSSLSSAIGGLFSFHGGGIVGLEGASGRSVPAAAFAAAPRFHAGMMPGEYPAILQRGEGVFTPGQMAAMGGARVEVNIINNSGAQVRTQERDQGDSRVIDVMIEQVDGFLARNVSRGTGALSTAMERTFGLNRAAGAVR